MIPRLLSLIFVVLIFTVLGEQGIYGALLSMTLFHIAYRAKHGYWWQF